MSRDIHFIPDDSNPYAPPAAAIQDPPPNPEQLEFRHFLRWEKLRLLYNAILGIETSVLLLMFPPQVESSRMILPLAGLCFAANVCFCLGPVLNGYARWMGIRHMVMTGLIFAAGTALAMLLAFVAVFSMSHPFSALD